MQRIIITLIMIALGSQTGFASEIFFESAVQIKKNNQSVFMPLPAGQSLPMQAGESAFILTSQNIPVLIYAIQNKDSKITLEDSNVSAAIQEYLTPNLQKATHEIIEGLRKTEALIQKRDLSQAVTIVTALKEKYQNIPSVLFMSGTVHYLMNKKSSAIEDLQKGLMIDSNNESAKKLLAQLKGSL